jgi:hypothetical protein
MARHGGAPTPAPPEDEAPPLVCEPADGGACVYSLPPDPTAAALLQLLRAGALCDALLVPADGGEPVPAHRVVLAATCGFFRALFTVSGGSGVLPPADARHWQHARGSRSRGARRAPRPPPAGRRNGDARGAGA